MQRNTHKKRTKLINNKRTSKRVRTLKKHRINKQRGGETKFSSLSDVVHAAKDYAADKANLAGIGMDRFAQNINDKLKNVTGDITTDANLLYNAVPNPSDVANSTIRQKVTDAFKVTSNNTIMVATQSVAPAYTGVEGEMVPVVNGGNYYIYVYIGGAWRSSSLA